MKRDKEGCWIVPAVTDTFKILIPQRSTCRFLALETLAELQNVKYGVLRKKK